MRKCPHQPQTFTLHGLSFGPAMPCHWQRTASHPIPSPELSASQYGGEQVPYHSSVTSIWDPLGWKQWWECEGLIRRDCYKQWEFVATPGTGIGTQTGTEQPPVEGSPITPHSALSIKQSAKGRKIWFSDVRRKVDHWGVQPLASYPMSVPIGGI